MLFSVLHLSMEFGGVVRGAACWFLVAQPRNNHTETILFKTLLGPLALDSYWLILIS